MPSRPLKKHKKVNSRHDPGRAVERAMARLPARLLRPKPLAAFDVRLRPFQRPIFNDNTSGILVLHWSRQIGKSYVLAAWAVCRLLDNPGRLVTVLSNSRDNGGEFLAKCVEICNLNRTYCELVDESLSLDFEALRMELRIISKKKTGRIKVLAANPRTARGFSGDLILDEFAFHENSAAIWEAAEPILASNPDFLCRIASTGNGKHNLFYRMAAAKSRFENRGSDAAADVRRRILSVNSHDSPPPHAGGGNLQTGPEIAGPDFEQEQTETAERGNGNFPLSAGGFKLSRVTRTQAHEQGALIFDANTRKPIAPEVARAQALDKRAYDQNYECAFADENLTLLSHELISAAEHDDAGSISEQDWSAHQLSTLQQSTGPLYAGFDVARKADLSVITVLEKLGEMFFVRAILRMQDTRLPDQQLRLGEICRLPQFQRAAIDMTGLGLGLFEYAQKEFGPYRIHGINFATTVPATRAIQQEGRKRETVRVTEALALELLQTYEDRRIQHPADPRLRDDLSKPERLTTPGGRVSIAATRDEAGHADHFWSLALALEAAATASAPFAYESIKRSPPSFAHRRLLI